MDVNNNKTASGKLTMLEAKGLLVKNKDNLTARASWPCLRLRASWLKTRATLPKR
jgi:hypothetical protein